VTDEPRNEEPEAPADETPTEVPEEPAAQAPTPDAAAEETPAAEPEPAPAEETPAAEPVTEETPTAEEQPAAEPVAEEAPAVEPEPAPAVEPEPAPAEETPAAEEAPAAEEQPPAAAAEEQPPTVEEQLAASVEADADDGDDVEVARRPPEIPGADLIPDIVSDGDEFMDAEARAAAEAEAEERALSGDEDSDEESKPIADAAIDLAAGARYTATGKRKTAVARVILRPGTGTYSINGKVLDEFFPRDTLRRNIRQPLEAVGYDSRMDVVARMHGGGVSAQAGALRHGISRALIVADPNLRGELKRRGFLTRDPRVKERKKAGLKKARKRPQFSKR
jgi:small subunit ribosomal protein S9